MKISIPLTGTVISYNPLLGKDDDPIRPIELDLGNVSWQLISLDIEHDLALIEVTPGDEVDFETGAKDEKGDPVTEARPTTKEEKQAEFSKVERLMDNSVARLYEISGSPRLKKPLLTKIQ